MIGTVRDGKYIPKVNALKNSVPVEWLEDFAKLVLATAKAVQKIEGQKRLPLSHEQKVVIERANTIGGYNGDYYDPFGIMEDVEEAQGIK